VQPNRDVLVDGDDRYVAQPTRGTHEAHQGPLHFVAAMQRVTPWQKAGDVTQIRIQRLP
jgi:hypothetical protein